jgi:hypothetical protein
VLVLGLVDATRKALDSVPLIMAEFLQHARKLAGFAVDGSGQPGDAVDIAAAIRKAITKCSLDTAAVAFDGFG